MPAITEVACWAHCRRSIFDVWQTTKSTVAKTALDRIAQFYTIEDKARFAPPVERLAHRRAIIPLLDAFFTWAQLAEPCSRCRRGKEYAVQMPSGVSKPGFVGLIMS